MTIKSHLAYVNLTDAVFKQNVKALLRKGYTTTASILVSSTVLKTQHFADLVFTDIERADMLHLRHHFHLRQRYV